MSSMTTSSSASAATFIRITAVVLTMRTRIKRVMNRAKYAAVGAAAGGALGGLFSRNAASTAAGVGALVGATIGEKRGSVDAVVTKVKDGTRSERLLRQK